MRLAQRAKRTLLSCDVKNVLVPPSNNPYVSVAQRRVDTVLLEILSERQALASALAIRCEPPGKRFTMHPLWFSHAAEIKNRRRQRRLISYEIATAAALLTWCPNDERNVDNRAGQI